MTVFRICLLAYLVLLLVYTLAVIADHGLNLFPVFFGDMMRTGWPGQFNMDFLGFLGLSGFWLAWRHRFSPAGLGLGVLGFLGGYPVLAVYLLVASYREADEFPAGLMQQVGQQ